jgi:predicted GH43/DUF377 family glycosyl hydrolase
MKPIKETKARWSASLSAALAAIMVIGVGSAATADEGSGVEVTPGPVFAGQLPRVIPGIEFAVAGDPSIVVAGDELWMYYGCYGFAENGTQTCLATSPDGETWTDYPVGSAATFNRGQVLFGTPGAWDMAHETPYAVRRDDATYLYFVGYDQTSDGFFGTDRVPMGLAISSDGVNFGATTEILSPEPGGLDDHGFTSPTVFPWGDGWGMTYTAWCFRSVEACPRLAGGLYVTQMGATSPDGVTWTKLGTNLVPDEDLPDYALGGLAETHVFQVPDGRWAMLHQGLTPDSHHVVGIAMAATPFGPWRFREEPLITPETIGHEGWPPGSEVSAVAPHGRISDGRLRIWFAGESAGFRIGYAEGAWPVSGTTFVPMPPTAVTATSHDDRATVTWSAPADDGGAAITGYDVEYSADGGPWVSAGSTSSTSLEVGGLPRDASVVFRASATNSEGASDPSSPSGSVDIPPLPAAAPGRMSLSDDSSHDGIRDGSYVVTADLWWGQNGTEYRLYENGVLVHSAQLDDRTPDRQSVSVPITGRPDGEYRYTCELENGRGVTACAPRTVRVTQALPAKPALSAPGRDADGTFTLAADLWWGTNASSWSLTENGVPVATGALTVATPSAQHVDIPLAGRAPGRYDYVVRFHNAFGSSVSTTVTVRVG